MKFETRYSGRFNPFKEFIWERDGNGNYIVEDLITGNSITAIPCLGKAGRYRIHESEEKEMNYYGQAVPKIYNRFEVMAFCRSGSESKKVNTHTREGFTDA